VLSSITKYLLQYHRVAIPNVGTIEIVQQPAELNFVDRLLFPPKYIAQLRKEPVITDHQLNYLASAGNTNKEVAREELEVLGEKIRRKIDKDSFHWNGIGLLSHDVSSFPVESLLLEPVTAEKVKRENAEHNVLIGDQEIVSRQQSTSHALSIRKKRPMIVTIGWIVLALALAAIIYFLVSGNFSIYSSGSRMKP
jgi:hypothetical protein